MMELSSIVIDLVELFYQVGGMTERARVDCITDLDHHLSKHQVFGQKTWKAAVKIALQHRSDRFGSGCGICICACSEFVEHTMMKRVRRFALLIDIKRIERCVLVRSGDEATIANRCGFVFFPDSISQVAEEVRIMSEHAQLLCLAVNTL